MSSPPHLQVGARLGEQFLITRCLEQGTGLASYEASVAGDEAARALLALVPLSDPEAIASIEARTLAIRALGSSRILPLERADDWEKYACFASSPVVGHPLSGSWAKDWVAGEQFCEVFARIGGALRAAHRVGLFHGWLTPQSIYIGEADRGAAWITDLGLAGIRRDAVSGGNSVVTTQLGELAYIAPELLALAQPADARADIYSFGALLYRALTGRSPFQATNTIDFALHKRQVAPTTLQAIRPDLPVTVAQTIDRSLAPDPGSRPASMDEHLHALRMLAAPYSSNSASVDGLCRVWSAGELRQAVSSQEAAQSPLLVTTSRSAERGDNPKSGGVASLKNRAIHLACAAIALAALLFGALLTWNSREPQTPRPRTPASVEVEKQNDDWE